ncbi:hypothetical protein EP7_001115 [Isosphaeraceae bacterium EP7]
MTTRTLRIGGLATLLGLAALTSANAQNSVGNGISGTAGGQGATGTATAPSLRGTDQGNPRETIGSTGQEVQPGTRDDAEQGVDRRRSGLGAVPGQRREMRGANANSYAERAVIGHAVSMAIEASGLKACAELAGAKEIDQAQAQNDRQGGAAMDPAQQLMMHARQAFQDSQTLLGSAGGDIIGRDQLQPATDRNPGDKRIYQAAGGYISTLTALSGMNYGRPGANPDRVDASQKVMAMSPQDKATVALINHSVKEVIDGTHIVQASGEMQGASRATEALLRHGRDMQTNGTQTLMRLAGNQAPGDRKPGEASVMALAQHGRELIEAYAVAVPRGGEMLREPAGRREGAPGANRRVRDENLDDATPDARRPERDATPEARRPDRDAGEDAPKARRPAADEPEGGSILNGTAPSTKENPR